MIWKFLTMAAALAISAPVPGASAEDRPGAEITLPSGAVVRWQETLHDNSGGQGLTSRFRFVMPDLARLVPSTSGPASDFEGERGPIEIDTESGTVEGAPPGDDEYLEDDGMIAAETLDLPPAPAIEGAEEAADELLETPVLPAAPDVLAQDPVHRDVVWLCENWVLPRIASPGPRPRQIIISLSDRELPFGAYDPDTVQLFEAFRLPPDRDACEWEPW